MKIINSASFYQYRCLLQNQENKLNDSKFNYIAFFFVKFCPFGEQLRILGNLFQFFIFNLLFFMYLRFLIYT